MKNMKVRVKLLVGFAIVVVLTLVVGIVGILNLNTMNADYTVAVDTNGKPIEQAGLMLADLHAVRAELRAAMLFTGDAEKVATQRSLVQGFLDDYDANAAVFSKTLVLPETQALYNEANSTYTSTFLPALEKVLTDAENGVDQATLVAYMGSDIKPAIDTIIGDIQELMTTKSGLLQSTSAAADVQAVQGMIISLILLAVAVIISVLLGLYISGLIAKPLIVLSEFMHKAGSTGNLTLSEEDVATIGAYAQVRDEIGECIANTAAFVQHVTNVSTALGTVANGDLTEDMQLLSESDVMGLSLNKMVANLNTMFSEIRGATAQVATGSHQIADGAQTLAQGSTEQAATVEELSASISVVAEKTRDNAKLAGNAAKLADAIMQNAEKGNHQMSEMTAAVGEINEASQSISRVIKVIDDIAFQTNILALNAAVEAARAGQHGKGFAVVADEVRNLAAKSASAAKDTGELIANSMQKAELGSRIAADTAASLAEIVSGINESNQIVGRIAISSEEQDTGIRQITDGIDQVAQVVQQNSATAEESAAASEELSSQSSMLDQLISQFKLRNQRDGGSMMLDAGLRPADETSFALSGSKY